MRLNDLLAQLETSLNIAAYRDAWPTLDALNAELTAKASPELRERGNGLLLRGSDEVGEVYTAVFPTAGVLDGIMARALPGSLLISHYPQPYDGRAGFQALSAESVAAFLERGLSLYVLHAPLAYGERMSTWRALARRLSIAIEGQLDTEVGTVGCYGQPHVDAAIRNAFDFASLVYRVEQGLGIKNSQVVRHGSAVVTRVAVVPGDGADVAALQAAWQAGCTAFVTGVLNTEVDDPSAQQRSQRFMLAALQLDMDLIGASIYATCAPGMTLLATWCQSLGLPAAFIEGEPELAEFMEG